MVFVRTDKCIIPVFDNEPFPFEQTKLTVRLPHRHYDDDDNDDLKADVDEVLSIDAIATPKKHDPLSSNASTPDTQSDSGSESSSSLSSLLLLSPSSSSSTRVSCDPVPSVFSAVTLFTCVTSDDVDNEFKRRKQDIANELNHRKVDVDAVTKSIDEIEKIVESGADENIDHRGPELLGMLGTHKHVCVFMYACACVFIVLFHSPNAHIEFAVYRERMNGRISE